MITRRSTRGIEAVVSMTREREAQGGQEVEGIGINTEEIEETIEKKREEKEAQ